MRSGESAAWLSLLLALGVVACGSSEDVLGDVMPNKDAESAGAGGKDQAAGFPGLSGGNGATTAGAGGAVTGGAGGRGGLGSSGKAGSAPVPPPKGGSGGGAGAGTAGSAGNVPPMGTAGSKSFDQVSCGGSYDPNAAWPGLGRCADRSGKTPAIGPKKFLRVRVADLGVPITTSPVVSSTHVYVATALGVFRIDRELGDPVMILPGTFASTPVLVGERIYAVSTDGLLRYTTTSSEGPGVPIPGKVSLPPVLVGTPDPTWRSSLAVGDGKLFLASPDGRLVTIVIAPLPTVAEPIKANGLGTSGSVTIDRFGDVFLPTSTGVFKLPQGNAPAARFGTEAVEVTPVSSEAGVLFGDVTGRLLRVSPAMGAGGSETGNVALAKGALLAEAPTGAAAVGKQSFVASVGKVLKIVTVTDADDGAPIVDALAGQSFFSAVGPIVAPPAVDGDEHQIVASTDGNLYLLNAAGVVQDSFLTDGALVSQPAIVQDGVYFGSSDEKLYFLGGTAEEGSAGAGGNAGGSGKGGSGGTSAGAAGTGGISGGAAGSGGKAGGT